MYICFCSQWNMNFSFYKTIALLIFYYSWYLKQGNYAWYYGITNKLLLDQNMENIHINIFMTFPFCVA